MDIELVLSIALNKSQKGTAAPFNPPSSIAEIKSSYTYLSSGVGIYASCRLIKYNTFRPANKRTHH